MKAIVSFGRMNPISSGHEKLVSKVKSEAKKLGADPKIYLSHSFDPKKNPLDYDLKISLAKKVFGPAIIKSTARTLIDVLKELESKGYTDVVVVGGSDRVEEFKTLITKYNGKEYNFKTLDVVSAGERDPDADDVSGMSASKLRAIAAAGEYELFKKGTPSSMTEKDKKIMYEKVRSNMGINEAKTDIEDIDFDITDDELEAHLNSKPHDEFDDEPDLEDYDGDDLEEARAPLTIQQRLKRSRMLKRIQPKIHRKREVAMKRLADAPHLLRRARKAAINFLRKKYAGSQGQHYSTLPAAAKITVDRIISTKMGMIDRIATRLLPRIKKAEQERFKNRLQTNSYVNESFILEEDDTKLRAILQQAFKDNGERMLVFRALKGGEKSLSNSKLRPYLLKLLNRLLDASQSDPSMFSRMRDILRRMDEPDQVSEVALKKFKQVREGLDVNFAFELYEDVKKNSSINEYQDSDIKHLPGSQPAKYHKGLKKATKVSRDKHFKKYADKDDSNSANYKQAPGDHLAKTKPSEYTKKYDAMFEQFIEENVEGLKNKAEKSGISYGILKKVYDRGMAAWKSGHRPGANQQQWAFARVNSFIVGGKTRTTADADLWKQHNENTNLNESFVAGISDTMYALDFAENRIRGDFAFHPSVMEAGGAGEEGTYAVKKKYKDETPGEVKENCSCSEQDIQESEYKGRKVKLNDPFRSNDGDHKFYVYVKNEKGNVIKLGFGDPNMEIKRDNPNRLKSFRARHNCDDPGPKWKARYWACYNWRPNVKVDD